MERDLVPDGAPLWVSDYLEGLVVLDHNHVSLLELFTLDEIITAIESPPHYLLTGHRRIEYDLLSDEPEGNKSIRTDDRLMNEELVVIPILLVCVDADELKEFLGLVRGHDVLNLFVGVSV